MTNRKSGLRKPPKNTGEKKSSEAAIRKAINKGGREAATNGDKSVHNQLIPLPMDMVEKIDAARESRTVPTPRTKFMLEAIDHFLENEESV